MSTAIRMSQSQWDDLVTTHPELAQHTPTPDTTPATTPDTPGDTPASKAPRRPVVESGQVPQGESTSHSPTGLIWAVSASVMLNVVMVLLLIALHVRSGQLLTYLHNQSAAIARIGLDVSQTCTLDAPYATPPATPHMPRTR